MTEHKVHGRESKMSIFIILMIGFVDYLGIGLIYPLFAVLLFDHSLPIVPADSSPEFRGAMLGILIAMTPIAQFFFSPILGAFSDVKGRRKALIMGVGFGCAGYLIGVAGILFNSLYLLFLYRFFIGVSDATAAVAQATLSDIGTKKTRVKLFAYLNASFGFGFTLGPFLGSILADPTFVHWFNYSTPFMFAGLMTFMNLLLVTWILPETRKHTHHAKFDFIQGIHRIYKAFFLKNLRWLFFGGFMLSFGWAVFYQFLPLMLYDNFGLVLSSVGIYFAYSGLCFAFGALLATRFVHDLNPSYVIIISSLIAGLSCLSFILFREAHYIWLVLPPLMISMSFAFPTATTIVSHEACSESQGEVLGIYQAIGAVAMGLSPILMGPVIGIHPMLTAWGSALCFLITGIAFYLGQHHITLNRHSS